MVKQHVYRRNWSEAEDILQTHPNSVIVNYVDRYKRCPLHWACMKGASTRFLKLLVENFHEATIMRDFIGRTPLHLSCEFASDPAVFAMLQATDPTVATYRDDKSLRSLLAETIVNSRSPKIIDSILQANKRQIVMKDNQGNTPMVIFMRKNLGALLACHSGIFSLIVKADDLIETASILSTAEVEMQMGTEVDPNGDILSNAIMIPSCPFAFVNFALSENPNQGKERDINGDLPIHIACRVRDQGEKLYKCDDCGNVQMSSLAYYFSQETTSLRAVLCENCKTIEDTEYSKVTPSYKIRGTVKALLDLDETQASAICGATDELPLVISLKNGQSWSSGPVEELVNAYPSALSKSDKVTGLFPFQLAALGPGSHHDPNNCEDNRDWLNTIYQLLLKWPMSDKSEI